jgi:hypothetical protein
MTNSANGPSLRLAPSPTYMPDTALPGSINATAGGELEFQATPDIPTLINTSYTATQTWPVTPFRALDTRGLGGVSGNGRELILNPGVLTPSGLPAGQTLLLRLTDFVKYGWAVLGNATVQGPEANGFVTIALAGVTRPNTSSINFLKGWPLSNAIVRARRVVDPGPQSERRDPDLLVLHHPHHLRCDRVRRGEPVQHQPVAAAVHSRGGFGERQLHAQGHPGRPGPGLQAEALITGS